MEVSEEALKVLSLFRKPKTFESAVQEIKASQAGKRRILRFLETLAAESLLVSEAELASHTSIAQLSPDDVLVEAPKKTFFSCPEREVLALEDEDMVFLGVPFDLGTTGYPGARFGPDRIRELSCDSFQYHADVFSGACRGWFSLEKRRVVLEDTKMADVGNVLLQIGESFDAFYNRVTRLVEILLEKKAFPVIVGGDHSSTYGVVRALKQRYDSLAVLHIDAHTDLGEILPGLPNNHGNVFTRIRNEALIDHLYQFGVRGLIGEPLIAEDYSLFSLGSLNKGGIGRVVTMVTTDSPCFISIDIDVIDPSFAPGTGTPAANGMTPNMLFSLVSSLVGKMWIVGFEVVEVNPMLDVNNRTSELVVEIIFRALADIFSPPQKTRGKKKNARNIS